ncbi:DUF3486 family protein [Pseudovibrio ascidiaceicola]|uniref:DUF3486 family protein n=1 Tax=Pseudovibrio ascidiaceicola TaxID=285279 RepID=UPI003D369F8C
MSKRKGRGRLSSIDLLPPEASELVGWAARELAKYDRTQKEICTEFNEKLLKLDPAIQPISSSAFNRHAIALAETQRQMKETQEIVRSLSDQMEPGDVDEMTITISQMVKSLVLGILRNGADGITPKGAVDLANAMKSATQAQAISTRRRKEIETEFEKKTDEALEKTAQVAGLNSDQVAKLRREFLGLRK